MARAQTKTPGQPCSADRGQTQTTLLIKSLNNWGFYPLDYGYYDREDRNIIWVMVAKSGIFFSAGNPMLQLFEFCGEGNGWRIGVRL